MREFYLRPDLISHSACILHSYQHWLGQPLIALSDSAEENAARLFNAPLVVLAHDTQRPPCLTYANQSALDLWEASLEALIGMPSQQTAEPDQRELREEMLETARRQGYFTGYQGVRIGLLGRRFRIEGATVFNLLDAQGNPCGQAATFAHWHWLSPAE